MENINGNNTIGLAYVNREKEREFNKDKYEREDSDWSCCSIDSVRDWVIERYNSKQKYIHCELAFAIPNGPNCLAYGVFEDKGVVEMQRTFSNKSYQWIFLTVTQEQYNSVIRFCKKQVGKPYDYSSTSWRLIACPIVADYKQWWCASFVHAALQKAGLLKHYTVNTLDVDDIVDLISKHKKKIVQGSTPFMLKTAIGDFGASMFGEHSIASHKMFGKDGPLVSCKKQ